MTKKIEVKYAIITPAKLDLIIKDENIFDFNEFKKDLLSNKFDLLDVEELENYGLILDEESMEEDDVNREVSGIGEVKEVKDD